MMKECQLLGSCRPSIGGLTMTIPEQTGEENQVRMTRNVLMTYQKVLEEPEEDNYNL